MNGQIGMLYLTVKKIALYEYVYLQSSAFEINKYYLYGEGSVLNGRGKCTPLLPCTSFSPSYILQLKRMLCMNMERYIEH